MRAACAFLLLCALAAPSCAEPVVYTLDPAHSFVNFELRHFGTSTIRGRFGPLDGSVTLDRAAASGSIPPFWGCALRRSVSLPQG